MNISKKYNPPIKTDKLEKNVKIAGLISTGVGLILTAVALWFNSETNKSTQKWRVYEFTSAKYKEFSQNELVCVANQMLDYKARSYPLFKNEPLITISDDVIYSALVVDSIRNDYTEVEVKIRDVFDEYFDQLSQFNKYAKAGLISYEQIKPYLQYQVSILADTANHRKTNDLKIRINDYLDYYGYSDVKELYKKLGYNISSFASQIK